MAATIPSGSGRRIWRLIPIFEGAGSTILAAVLLIYSRAFSQAIRNPNPAVDWVLDVVICTAAALSRRWLIPAGIVVGIALTAWLFVPSGYVVPFGIFAFCIPIYSAVVSGRGGVGKVLALWYGMTVVVLFNRTSEGIRESAATVGLVAIAVAATWMIGTAIHRYVRNLEDLRLVHQAESQLLRGEIARDLHDTVAGAMTRIVMRVEAAKLRGISDPESLADLDYILDTGRQGSHDLRALLIALRDSDQPVSAAPLWNIDSLGDVIDERAVELRQAGFTVESAVDLEEERLPPSIRNTMGKVVVEATSNILKHAVPGSAVTILVEQDTEQIEALFLNRVGAKRTKSERHLGLVGIGERLNTLGGELEHHKAGNTWVLNARLPLKGSHERP